MGLFGSVCIHLVSKTGLVEVGGSHITLRERKESTGACVCMKERKKNNHVVFSALTDCESRYSDKDQRSMLVWSPNSQVSDAMRK